MKIVLVDSNILLRYFLQDIPELYEESKKLFTKASVGDLEIYLDNVVVAETIWVLTSYYKKPKQIIVPLLEKFISQSWITNSKKELLMQALELFLKKNLSYIDCWAYISSKDLKVELKTFDKDLEKFSRAT